MLQVDISFLQNAQAGGNESGEEIYIGIGSFGLVRLQTFRGIKFCRYRIVLTHTHFFVMLQGKHQYCI